MSDDEVNPDVLRAMLGISKTDAAVSFFIGVASLILLAVSPALVIAVWRWAL